VNQYVAALAASVTTFAATNIDDALLLTLFFARRVPTRRIVAGQYLGFAAIIAASLIGAWAALSVPHRFIRLLGLMPLAIGIRYLLRARHGESEPLRASNFGVASIALLTLSNGADNVGVYVPLFVVARAQVWLILIAYALLVAIWCFLARRVGKHPLILRSLDRGGHWVVPLVFIGLGVYVLKS
jgi:cadmium resistance protein CadD (predicted permease)